MCHIYYPYFKIEKSTQNKKYNHKPILFTAMPCEVAESHMITVF